MTHYSPTLKQATAAHAKIQHRTGRAEDASRSHGQRGIEINVGEFERHASMIGGTALAIFGLLNRSLSGLALAALGGALIYRGHTGHCDMYQQLGYSSATNDGERACQASAAQSQQRPPAEEL
jgi:uncharacterized membrane protein